MRGGGHSTQHAKLLRATCRELGVGGLLASVGGAQNRSILCGRAGVGLAIARERRDEGCIAAERATQGCGAVDDEVKAPAVVGRDAWCCGVDEPLLGHHVSLRPHGITGNLAPGPFFTCPTKSITDPPYIPLLPTWPHLCIFSLCNLYRLYQSNVPTVRACAVLPACSGRVEDVLRLADAAASAVAPLHVG